MQILMKCLKSSYSIYHFYRYVTFILFFTANTGAFAGGMIHFLTYFPYFFLGDDNRYASMTLTQKILACVFSNNAMAFGVKTIASYEGTGMNQTYFLMFLYEFTANIRHFRLF